MKTKFVFWVERYFYTPTFSQKIISYLLSPLSFVYCGVMFLRYLSAKAEDMGIKVIGVGNLTVGGSGKTPVVTAIAKEYGNVAVVLRGYGRTSKGVVVVKKNKEILCNVTQSGDEAMIYALKLPDAIVIVAEDRKEGIAKAKALGARFVLLDDAYSKHSIKKLDFLIKVVTPNHFCLPSGPYREKLWQGKEVVIIEEEKDFQRKTSLQNPTQKMVLVTAIARPQRLEKYLPKITAAYYFEDHHSFTKEELEQIWKKEQPESFLVTFKDYVKMKEFGFPLSILDLELELNPRIFSTITTYLSS